MLLLLVLMLLGQKAGMAEVALAEVRDLRTIQTAACQLQHGHDSKDVQTKEH